MKVHALFFASYREAVDRARLSLSLPDGATAGELVRTLRDRGEPFDRLPAEPVLAVNERYASLGTPLTDDDVVAFIPPVAGG